MLGTNVTRASHPQVVDGRKGLQIRRVALNILNTQPWADNKVQSSSLGLGGGLQLVIKINMSQDVTESFRLGGLV
jgi:hypothetical protein